MATILKQNKVLIIGAGPGGLALAQILRNYKIPFEIFERDDADHVRPQGWAVALVECLPDLYELLPEDIGDLAQVSVNYGTDLEDSLAVVNAETGQRINLLGGVAKGQPGYVLRAGRERLRNFLSRNIQISTGKQFDHYVEHSDGVTVHFKDGTTAIGAILVGADGAHSHVRSQLLAGQGPILSRYVPVTGECELPRHLYEPIHQLSTATILSAQPGLRYLIGQLSIKPDLSSASMYYAVCYMVSSSEEDHTGAAAAAVVEKESARIATASKEELYEIALSKTQGMSPVLTDIIRHAGVQGMMVHPVKLLEFVPPETLPHGVSGRVTLLGDAAHTMIPFRGQGANTAIKDACDLARLLIGASRDKKEDTVNWSGILNDYNTVMLPRGREMVLSSRAAGNMGAEGLGGATKGRVITSSS